MLDTSSLGFLLHARAYRDTSLLVELFTHEHGRVGAIANHVHQKKSPSKALLQVFAPLRVSLQGKGDLLRLTLVEAAAVPLKLVGNSIACGFYLNELLMYCLSRHDPLPDLYAHYHYALGQLQTPIDPAIVLRAFELRLLAELGYGINFLDQAQSHQAIDATKYYQFLPLSGFCEVANNSSKAFLGAHLHAIHALDFSDKVILNAAQRLTRLALAPLLHGRVIHSRALFIQQNSS